MPDKVDYRENKITRNKEWYHIMILRRHRHYKCIEAVTKYMNEIWYMWKKTSEIYSYCWKTSAIELPGRQSAWLQKSTLYCNKIWLILCSTQQQQNDTYFPPPYAWNFTKMVHILGRKTNFNACKRTGIIQRYLLWL